MIRLTALTLAAIALAALALTACSDDSGGAADPNSDAGIFYCDLRTDCPDGYTCFDGRCIYQGPGAPDPPPAAEYYGQGCDQGIAFGCIGMGKLHEQGAGVRKNKRDAAKYFRRACELGADDYC